jgi:hypothetical protein
MGIPRKPNKGIVKSVEDFIKKEPSQITLKTSEGKIGRRIISLSLMSTDASWINEVLNKINEKTKRKITRSEIISAAISVLKEKKIDDIMQVIKNR